MSLFFAGFTIGPLVPTAYGEQFWGAETACRAATAASWLWRFPKPVCEDPDRFETRLIFDNDSFRGRGTDGQYTQGFRFESAYGDNTTPPKNLFGWSFGQEMYTPTKIDVPEIQPDDRPYAGLFYLGVFSENVVNTRGEEWYTKASFELAFLGRISGVELTQSAWHTVSRTSALPRGWDNQVDNEFGFIYRLEHVPFFYHPTSRIDWAPVFKLNLGTIFDDFSVSSVTRWGQLNGLNSSPATDPRECLWVLHGCFFFNRIEVKFVAYNALLQRRLVDKLARDENRPNTERDIYPVTKDAELGFAASFGPYQVRFSLVARSSEFRQEGKKWERDFHEFARIHVIRKFGK